MTTLIYLALAAITLGVAIGTFKQLSTHQPPKDSTHTQKKDTQDTGTECPRCNGTGSGLWMGGPLCLPCIGTGHLS